MLTAKDAAIIANEVRNNITVNDEIKNISKLIENAAKNGYRQCAIPVLSSAAYEILKKAGYSLGTMWWKMTISW